MQGRIKSTVALSIACYWLILKPLKSNIWEDHFPYLLSLFILLQHIFFFKGSDFKFFLIPLGGN